MSMSKYATMTAPPAHRRHAVAEAPPEEVVEQELEQPAKVTFRPTPPKSLAEAGLTDAMVDAIILKYLMGVGSAPGAKVAATLALPHPLVVERLADLKRQLGMAILMHDAAHRALFSNRKLNDWAGNWLCAYPIWSDTIPYRRYHLQHHAKTGGPEDPDLGLVTPFPITRSSLRRKVWRDLSGKTGIKFAKGAWKRTFGLYGQNPVATNAARGVAVTNAVLIAVLGGFVGGRLGGRYHAEIDRTT